ncbi:MAG: efflux RND transporter periplasmic adaptor subunit [Xanthomonadales bacterium]|nr:efflux RND transporter periplasmic adaptor subunit [Xanthomonadales bacterium]
MKRFIYLILVSGAALLAGYFFGSQNDSEMQQPATQSEPEVLYWVAPMDPDFRRDAPGKSPMGMDLVPVYAKQSEADDSVRINPALQNNLGVRTVRAAVRPLWRQIEATGYVGLDETRISHINLRTEGWIESLAVNAEGERVKRGEVLFELYSPELVNAQKELLQALRRQDQRLASGAEEKLRALGMIPSEIETLRTAGKVSQHIKVVAPRDGVVTALNVREGMFVQPNMTIMSLANLDSVWILAEVFESQSEWVATGQAAEASLDYIPGSVFSGEVDYVYPVLDPDTRTLRVRLRFDNPGEKLKPNMYARVSVFGRLRPRALTIPRVALIRGPERDRVVVAQGNGRFRVHEVLAGMESGEWVEVVAGIEEGDEIVTSAQFLIDSEASLAGSILRLGREPEIESDPSPVTAFGSGWIEEIKPAERRMRISHGPIDALGWPAMNMELEVEPGIELERFKVGQDIRFQLRQAESGRFVVSSAFLPDADDADVNIMQEMPGHEGHDHD